MVKIPVLRWGQPYESLEHDNVIHFGTGETLAKVSQANPGLLARDMKKAQRAREVLREIPISQLIQIMKKAGELYKDATRQWAMANNRPTISRASNPPPPAPEHSRRI
jgi:acyl-CoA reductase-like NAD-dependent aldehyde dehydrogenase